MGFLMINYLELRKGGILSQMSRRFVVSELLSVLSRVIPAAFFTMACYGFWGNFLRTGKWTSLFWMASEGMVVLLLVFRRESTSLSRKPWDWLVGIAGSFFVLLVRPESRTLVPDGVGFAVQLAGTLFELYGKIALGRSFGIIAANRGIVVKGPYRLVRHPIYLGYLVTHVGFVLSNWSTRNLVIYAVTYFFQVTRIFSEERLLAEDESYRAYCEQVRFRLFPGIF